MQGMATAEVMTEARDRINIVSELESIRGTIEPSKQKLLDTMSAVLTNEQGAIKLYDQYSKDTSKPDVKKAWQEFGEQTRVHAQVAEQVIKSLGGDPNQKSAVAKEIDKTAQTMLKIDAKGDEADVVRLGYLMQAEALCHHHWNVVAELARHVKDSGQAKILMDAARIVERDEDEHFQWNAVMFDRAMSDAAGG